MEQHGKKDKQLRKEIEKLDPDRRMMLLFNLWAYGYGSMEPYDTFMERTGHYPAIRRLLSDRAIRRQVQGRILDLSCGSGAVLEMLLEHCEGITFIQANDTNRMMQSMARKRLETKLRRNAVFTNEDIERWPPWWELGTRHSFDVVLLSQTWHLLKSKILIPEWLHDSPLVAPLKEDGKLLIIDEFPASFSGEQGAINMLFNSILRSQTREDFLRGFRKVGAPMIERVTDIDGRHAMHCFLMQLPDPTMEKRAKEMLWNEVKRILELVVAYKEGRVQLPDVPGEKSPAMRGYIDTIRPLLTDPGMFAWSRIDVALTDAVRTIRSMEPRFRDRELEKEMPFRRVDEEDEY